MNQTTSILLRQWGHLLQQIQIAKELNYDYAELVDALVALQSNIEAHLPSRAGRDGSAATSANRAALRVCA